MRYIVDHDYHIHSQISACSNDPEQTPERILSYAQENGFRRIVLTDHFWDDQVPGASDWYKPQNFDRIVKARPLPQGEDVAFLFGAEADMDMHLTVGVADSRWDAFDFVIISTTHLHMRGFTISEEEGASAQGRVEAWIRRLDSLLSKDLPFHKIGIAHLACGTIAHEQEMYREVLSLLPDQKLEELFAGCAQAGVGIELNQDDMRFQKAAQEQILRIFRIAKNKGCKFYLGSDAHHPREFASTKAIFENAVSLLGLTEDDKFHIKK